MEMFVAVVAGGSAIVGATAILLGFLFLVLSAFGQSVAWGLGVLIFPFLGIPFAIFHKEKASYGGGLILKGLAGILVFIALAAIFIPPKP